jgi:serine/threonine protein kinase/tetratricopeptide (TPR) repeat protein
MSLPELFGSYLLHRKLARGTISDVFLAQTIGDFPRVCAVKCIRPEVAALPGFLDRFRNDAALLVRLVHGNLVQVLEVGAVEERLFMAMELIDGVDLSELIAEVPKQGPLPPELALYVGLEMCEAASYITARRQETTGASTFPPDRPWPLEVMLSFDGVVKIADLGSFGAIHLGQQKVSQVLKSPGHSVPEVLLKRPLDARSDLFAIGLVLWELLIGQPLVRSDPEKYVREVLGGDWKAPLAVRKDLSGDVSRLVGAMLSLDPAKRPPSVEAVRRGLVESLRRMAPAYGSSSVSQLLWRRCGHLIRQTEQIVDEVTRISSTERDFPSAAPTLSFGHASAVDRQVEQAAKLEVGDAIPGTRYRVVRMVGEGGSAQVFAAQHIDLDRQVALKILSPQLAANSAAIAQFRLEARACSRVGHPNIVDVIDFGELPDGRFFFAMELLDGKSLADLLDTYHTLPPERAIGIVRQIAQAAHAAHEHGIVHRDLKPENVMLVTRDGREDFVKVLDFGVMAFGADDTGRTVGTSGYMAPEQVRGERPTPAMDIYALGASLYEILAGVSPYPADTYEEFAEHQATSPPPALRSHPAAAELPEGLERVVHRALERDPAARHASMADLEADLLRAQREAGFATAWDDLPPLTGQVDQRIPPPRKAARSTRVWVAAFVAGIALVTALGAIQLYLSRSDSGAPQAPARAPATTRGAAELAPELVALLRQAEQAAAEGRFTHPAKTCALDLLLRVDKAAPGNGRTAELRSRIARVLEGAGDRLREAGMQDSARTLYQEALLFDPNSTRLRGSADPGEHPAPAAARASPPAPKLAEVAWLLSQVQLAVMEGRYISPPRDNALHLLMRLKRVDPSGRRLAQAQATMTRGIKGRAEELWRRGETDQARALYQLLVLLDPEDARARKRAQHRDPDAGSQAPKAQAAAPAPRKPPGDPARARRLVAEGRRLLDQGQLAGARGQFQAAVQANPADAGAYAGLAQVAFEEARYSATVELARRVVTMNPRQVQGHILLGDAYYKLLRYDEARRAWERALQLDPDNPTARRRIQRLQRVN